VDRETIPKLCTFLLSKVIRERLRAMDIQVIHDKVDCIGVGVAGDDRFHGPGELGSGTVRVTIVKCTPAFGSTAR